MADDTLHTVCPWCRKNNDAATSVFTIAVPKEGDVSMCIGCGSVALFAADLSLRKPTRVEQFDIDSDLDVLALRKAWRMSNPR